MIVVNSQVCKCVSKKAKIKVGTWNMEFLLLSTKKFEDCQECQTTLISFVPIGPKMDFQSFVFNIKRAKGFFLAVFHNKPLQR